MDLGLVVVMCLRFFIVPIFFGAALAVSCVVLLVEPTTLSVIKPFMNYGSIVAVSVQLFILVHLIRQQKRDDLFIHR